MGKRKRMNDEQLDRALQSVGMGCFVKYFDEFSKESQSVDVAELLFRNENWTERSCRSRVSHARRIVRAGRSMDTLKRIGAATRVSESVRDEALQIAADPR